MPPVPETIDAITYVKGRPIPQTLYLVQAGRKNLYLAKAASEDYNRMRLAAASAGVFLHLNSAFRDNAHQEILYEKYTKAYAEWEYGVKSNPPTATVDEEPTPVARPGYSNHQSGTAIDLQRADRPGVDAWMASNAERFHFYRTVPREPWHFDHKLEVKLS